MSDNGEGAALAKYRIMLPRQTSAAAILRRIDRRLKALGMTDNAASVQATGSRDTIRSIRRNVSAGSQRGISTETLRKLAPVLKTPEQWLLYETGPESVEDSEAAPQPSFLPRATWVPILSWVSAGQLIEAGSQMPLEDVPLLAFSDLGRGEFFALKVLGDSMDRVSPDGSIIIVNRADRQLIDGKAYVFSYRGEMTYKRWAPEPPHLAPFSTNPAHKPLFLKNVRELEVVGRVKRTLLDI